MQADLINGGFEMIGAAVLAGNVRQLLKDRHIAGVHWSPTLFFTVWGVWNLFYYPSLNQWASLVGAGAIVAVNLVWLGLLVRFSRPAGLLRG